MASPPLVRRIEHASDLGRWTLLRRTPPLHLASFVREMQGYREAGGLPVRRRELPSGTVPLIINLGPAFTLREPEEPARARLLRASFVAGLHERYALVGSPGEALCLQVNFTPLGARRFLGVPLRDLTNAVIDLDAIWGRGEAERLEQRLAAAPTWQARFALLDDVLAARLTDVGAAPPVVAAAWHALESSNGSIEIGALARRLDCSRQHLNTLFVREIGVSPKTAARVLRFERAVALLQAGRVASLADLAAACSYADQPHFSRECRAFAGESPSALAARMLPDGTGVMAKEDAW